MAFNGLFPATYSTPYPVYPSYPTAPQMQAQSAPQATFQPQAGDNGILFVNGIQEANAWVVQPGQNAFLMDRNENVFYIKSVNENGMPNPLEIYDYTKRGAVKPTAQKSADNTEYITREEFEQRLAEIIPRKQAKRTTKEVKDGESNI